MTTAAFLALAVLLVLASGAACLLLGRLDNRLGGGMLTDPRPDLHTRVRHWLGLDDITQRLRRIEDIMANEFTTMLQGLAAQTSDLTATQQAAFTNIHNGQARMEQHVSELKQQLTDALNNGGKVTPDMQAAATQISEALADLKKAATVASSDFDEPPADGDQGDQGGDTPPADGGDTPVDNGGDVPPADNGDDTGDVPPVVNSRH